MNIFEKRRKFGALYETHKNEVFSFIYYRCGRDQMLAEDVVSDVFLKAFDRFHLFDDTFSFRTWIFTITRNSIIDYFRKKKEVLLPHDELPEIPADDESFYAILDQEYDLDRIAKCLDALSPKQRLCVEERFFNGLSTSDIAGKHKLKKDAVEKNITRGLSALREIVTSKE